MKRILGAEIGDCIHVAGPLNFLQLAKQEGFETIFLGPAVSIDKLMEVIKRHNPDIVALGYRLSPQACQQVLSELKIRLSDEGLLQREYLFGGTVATAQVAKDTGIFQKIFDGTQPIEEIISFLRDALRKGLGDKEQKIFPDNLIDRVDYKHPSPLIRHHIGLPSVEATVAAVKEISEAGVLDVVSIAPDQTAQEFFFRPEEQKNRTKGAGGVPVRTEEDFVKIYEATRCGNYPLCRCYSGTNDVLKWAEMLARTIKNAWCAVPLSWYNRMDRRGPRPLLESIQEAQQLMKWHAVRGIPVEVNEAHQWSLRRAPDSIAVAMEFLAAYNAKKMGVEHYVAQYMFNTPAGISPAMDLAKMLAKIEMVESLHDDSFRSYCQVRPGLLSFPADLDAARGQLVFAIILGLMLKPHIVHVVAYCEAQYAAGAKEIVESVKMVDHVIKEYQRGFPTEAVLSDSGVYRQKEKLKIEAMTILEAIKRRGKGYDDPLTEPKVLAKAVEIGILDAPDLLVSEIAKGQIRTAIVDGSCVSIDPEAKRPLPEKERIEKIFASI